MKLDHLDWILLGVTMVTAGIIYGILHSKIDYKLIILLILLIGIVIGSVKRVFDKKKKMNNSM